MMPSCAWKAPGRSIGGASLLPSAKPCLQNWTRAASCRLPGIPSHDSRRRTALAINRDGRLGLRRPAAVWPHQLPIISHIVPAGRVMISIPKECSGMNARTIPQGNPHTAPPRFDRKFIEDHQLVERYLEGKLPFKGAQDLEKWCRANPEYLNELKLSDRAHAS